MFGIVQLPKGFAQPKGAERSNAIPSLFPTTFYPKGSPWDRDTTPFSWVTDITPAPAVRAPLAKPQVETASCLTLLELALQVQRKSVS
jgi:hypothetical protein